MDGHQIIKNNKILIDDYIYFRFIENNKRYFAKEIINEIECASLKTKIKEISFENIGLLEKLSLEKKTNDKPIYIFYHCFLEHKWEIIFKRQLEKIINSGLYGNCTKIFVSLKGVTVEIDKFKSIVSKYDKFEIFNESNQNTNEYIPLIKMRKFCETNDCYCLYLHFKGVFKETPFTWDWAEYMEYFCIEKWRLCALALDLGFDTAGVDFMMHEKKGSKMLNVGDEKNINFYYAGNFHFSSSKYIKKLRELTPSGLKQHRWLCETWIGEGKPNAFCFFMSLKWLYAEKHTREDYIKI